MAQEKTHKTEAERIADLEQMVMAFEDRFISLEQRRPQGGPGLEPITFYPFYMPMKGDLISDDAATACFEDITTPIDGAFVYDMVATNEACPDPTPAQKAKAAIEARKNLAAFAKTWCEEGNRACTTPNGCTPVLSNIRVTAYTTGSRPKDNGKKACFVTASITGTVSCRCT